MSIASRNSYHRRRPVRVGFAALALLLLAGCPPPRDGEDSQAGAQSQGGTLSGTYEAKQPEGSMTLEFKRGHKVSLTMQETGGQPETSEGDYLVDGNKITIQIPEGLPLVLVRDGKTLSANLMGQMLHFEKK